MKSFDTKCDGGVLHIGMHREKEDKTYALRRVGRDHHQDHRVKPAKGIKRRQCVQE